MTDRIDWATAIYLRIYERLNQLDFDFPGATGDTDPELLHNIVDYLDAEEFGRYGPKSMDDTALVGFWLYHWELNKRIPNDGSV